MNTPNPPLSIDQMLEIGYHAGAVIKRHFTPFGMAREVKGDGTPLTRADEETSQQMLRTVSRIAPHIDLVGEEHSDRKESPWRYYKDPIDGTFPFTWGMPIITNMQGLTYEGVPVMGAIFDPFQNRMYHAMRGKGARLNGEKALSVSRVHERKERPMVGYVSWPGCPYNILKVCQYLEERGVTLVNFCSIGYMEVAVATGEFAGTIFPGTHCHDTMPGHIIVTEAGGKVTDVFGEPINYTENTIRGHIMSNGHLHDLLVEAVKACN